jgi:hypothetical protein
MRKLEVRMPPKSERRTANPKRRKPPWPPGKQRLQGLVEEALLDAYDESEQRTGLFTMIEEHLALPFETKVLGVAVMVERIDFTAAGDIVTECRRGRERQSIPILDLPLPKPPPAGAKWIEAYRYFRSSENILGAESRGKRDRPVSAPPPLTSRRDGGDDSRLATLSFTPPAGGYNQATRHGGSYGALLA